MNRSTLNNTITTDICTGCGITAATMRTVLDDIANNCLMPEDMASGGALYSSIAVNGAGEFVRLDSTNNLVIWEDLSDVATHSVAALQEFIGQGATTIGADAPFRTQILGGRPIGDGFVSQAWFSYVGMQGVVEGGPDDIWFSGGFIYKWWATDSSGSYQNIAAFNSSQFQINGQLLTATLNISGLPVGTLAAPPSGLNSGDVWADTTTSTTNPILRIHQ